MDSVLDMSEALADSVLDTSDGAGERRSPSDTEESWMLLVVVAAAADELNADLRSGLNVVKA